MSLKDVLEKNPSIRDSEFGRAVLHETYSAYFALQVTEYTSRGGAPLDEDFDRMAEEAEFIAEEAAKRVG